MTPLAYAGTALIDASLVIALYDEDDEYYPVAREFFERHSSVLTWCALRVTGWEVFTRLRYSVGWDAAVRGYEFVRQDRIAQLDATPEDESNAWAKLHKYREHKLSFIDALCSTVALRHGVYRVATLDADFEIMGHEVLPPGTTKRERRRQRRRGDQ